MSLISKAKRRFFRDLYKPLKVFFYHQVSSRFVDGKDKESIFSTMDMFEKNLEYLRKHYQLISMPKANELFQQRKLRGERYAVITFDDGYANILEALDVLKKQRIPATIFANSKYVFERTVGVINLSVLAHSSLPNELSEEQKQHIDRLCDHGLQEEYKLRWDGLMNTLSPLPDALDDLYLTPTQLDQLDKSLFTIGMHGYEHYNSLQLTDEEFVENMERDRANLSQYSNFIPFFCFPYGYARESHLRLLRNAGVVPVLCVGGDNYSVKDVIYRQCLDGVKLY
jgi:peptidoglycan/xylan/chitin deacetylase (PgdA/CDA1 family)